jgi:hypothetical protein
MAECDGIRWPSVLVPGSRRGAASKLGLSRPRRIWHVLVHGCFACVVNAVYMLLLLVLPGGGGSLRVKLSFGFFWIE